MKLKIKNRLAVLLRERQIRSASEFGRRMTLAGYPISSSHASRYEKDPPPAFDLEFVNIACNVLQCLPSDMYEITVELDTGEDIDPALTIPRHALVLGSGGTQLHMAPIQPTVNLPEPTVSSSGSTSQKVGRKEKASTKSVTGPSGSIFPFTKS